MPSSVPPLLDVRLIPSNRVLTPVRRLARQLGVGESFVLMADHNPLPLCTSLRREHGVAVYCTLLHRSPQLWIVQVIKQAV